MTDKTDDKKKSKKPNLKVVKSGSKKPNVFFSDSEKKQSKRTLKPHTRPNARLYDREKITALVCAQIAEGKSLRSILDHDDKLPSVRTFLDWIGEATELATQYAQAREAGYLLLADELVAIADENYTTAEDGTRERLSNEAIARNRLRVDTRKWMLAKMLPKVYGDHTKVTNEHTGKGGGPIQLAAVDLRNLSDQELIEMETLMKKIEDNSK
jgi:hypothetical protein